MVEIIPFLEDDDDQSNWVPLAAGPPSRSASGDAAAAAAGGASPNASAARKHDNSASCTAEHDGRGAEHAPKGARDNAIRVEDAVDSDDEDGGWQKLSSPSRQEMQRHASTLNSASSDGAEWSWGKHLISHLTSTPTAPPSMATTSMNEAEDDAPGEEDIVWHRPNELDDQDLAGGLYGSKRASTHKRASIEEEYDDVDETKAVGPPPSKPIAEAKGQQPDPPHFRRAAPQRRKPREERPTIKKKLQEKLLHDPLRSLPLSFLRHFYREAREQFVQAWTAYLERNERHTLLAPLSLFVLIASMGVLLIAKGLLGLGILVVRASSQMMVSFCAWWVRYSWTMTHRLIWVSTCASLLLGAFVWVWTRVGARKNEGTELRKWGVPSISSILPWVVAVTSPSLLEALVIMSSLQTYAAVLGPEGVDECGQLPDGDEDHSCLADSKSGPGGVMSTLAMFAVALLVAAMNGLAISVAAKMLDRSDGGSSCEMRPSAIVEPPSWFSSATRLVQRNLVKCHAASVIAFAALTLATLLLHTLYVHLVNEGGDILLLLANGIGKGGGNIAFVGLGILVLLALWNGTVACITKNEMVLGTSLSFGEITRSALKESIIEVSSHAVWSGEGTGSGLLGILSDDDGAIRVAILEWAIDRWATSSSVPPSNECPSIASSDDDGALPNSDSSGSNDADWNPAGAQEHRESSSKSDTNSNTSTDNSQPPILPSYASLQNVVNKLDADETLIPTIESYRTWVYSLPPSQSAALCVALWKMCPAIATLGLTVLWLVATGDSRGLAFMCTIATVMSPMLYLEYHRVRDWWGKTASRMQNMDSMNGLERGDFAMTLLRADACYLPTQSTNDATLMLDTSSLILRMWSLLLESISVLESTIPVARCATVAGAAVDLTSNTFCLVDLALEVQKKGLLGGVGVLLWDAFNYHLSKELEQRQGEVDGIGSGNEDLGGQYTDALVNAGRNISKVSRNVSCLMEAQDRNTTGSANGDSGNMGSADSDQTSSVKQPNQDDGEQTKSSEELKTRDGHSDTQSAEGSAKSEPGDGSTFTETEPVPSRDGDIKDSSQENDESDQNDQGALPLLIGGGLAFVGAVAGIAMHVGVGGNASNAHGRKERKDKPE